MNDIRKTVVRGLISGLEFLGERIEDAVMVLDDLLFDLEESSNPRGIRGPTPNMVILDELNGEFGWLGMDSNGLEVPGAFVPPVQTLSEFLDSLETRAP